MAQKAIEGAVIDVGFEADPEVERLRAENRRLQRAVSDAELEAKRAREDTGRALSSLRRQLSPLYRALQMVFGELDDAGVTDDRSVADAPSNGRSSQWDEWKTRLGPNCAKVIDALLLGGTMNVKAIMVAARLGRDSVYQATSKMGQAGVVTKNGSDFSLKKL